MARYWALRCFAFLVPLVPNRLGNQIARILGALGYLVLRGARRNVIANLRHVLGEKAAPAAVESAAREVFITGALNYFDLFRVPSLGRAALERLITVSGWEHVEAARAKGRGLIVISPHLGNLDLVGQLGAIRNIPCIAPTEMVRPARLLDLYAKLRACRGITLVPLDGTAAPVRALYKALLRNDVVVMVSDRDVRGTGIPVRFFDAVTSFPDGTAALALRTGAPVIPVRSCREQDGRYSIAISAPLDLPRTGDVACDVRLGTELIAATFERLICQSPGQWVVFQPVWPARPLEAVAVA